MERLKKPILVLVLLGLISVEGCKKRVAPVARTTRTSSQVSVSGTTSNEISQSNDVPPEGVIPAFREVATELGIRFDRFDDVQGQRRFFETNGGGVALFDYDLDGNLDLFFANGCRLPLKLNDQSHPDVAYQNLGTSFKHRSQEMHLNQGGYHHGYAVGDFDGDGFDDLFVNGWGPDLFWHNNGDGTFTDITRHTGTSSEKWGSSAAFADLNLDGFLDLYLVNYVETGDDPPKLCPNARSPDGFTTCSPTEFSASSDVVYLNRLDGTFEDITQVSGFTGEDGKGLGVVVFDANKDGKPDVLVANDGMPNFLYINESSTPNDPPKFMERAMELGIALSYEGRAQSCMGIASGDYDADGDWDVMITNYHAETNAIYNNKGGIFVDETNETGIGPASRPTLGFGTEFLDFDNDGWLDVVVTNGHIDDLTWAGTKEPYRMPSHVFRNEGNGRFREISRWCGSYFQKDWVGRGLAIGDLDNDGDVDYVISHQRDPSVVLRNEFHTKNQCVQLRLIGTSESNRSAVGAQIDTEGVNPRLFREIVGGGSYQSASERRISLGIGEKSRIPRLRIRWPSGRLEEFPDVQAGQYVCIEGQGRLLPEFFHGSHILP